MTDEGPSTKENKTKNNLFAYLNMQSEVYEMH